MTVASCCVYLSGKKLAYASRACSMTTPSRHGRVSGSGSSARAPRPHLPRSPTSSTDFAEEFVRPAALRGVYRPSERGMPDESSKRPICHKKDLSHDLEWMVAHARLDDQAHEECRVWAKLDPAASKGLTFEEWEHAIGKRTEHAVGREVLRQLFDAMDINHDGRVSLQEFVDGQVFSALERLPNVDRKAKEAMKEHLLHAMRPQGGHGKHERLAREAGRWKVCI